MKKLLFMTALAVATVSFLFSETEQISAVVTKTSGKVEYMTDGSWKTLSQGMKLEKGAVIQTGFKSEAELQIKGSTVSISPLSRLTLEQIVAKEGKDETRIFLDTGSIRSNVKKSDDRAVGFKVRSPVATASVRGTELSVTNHMRSTDVKTYSGTVAVWKSRAKGAEVASASEDNAPAVLPGAGNTPNDIAGDGAPKSAFTVSKGQSAEFKNNGAVSTPKNQAAHAAFGMNGPQSAGAAEREAPGGGERPSRPAPAAVGTNNNGKNQTHTGAHSRFR